MRSGYWRILVRRLRHKIAAGANVFTGQNGTFVVDAVSADDDAALEGGELPLAECVQGMRLVVDASNTRVTMINDKSGERVPLNLELAAFVDALHSGSFGLELGPIVGEWEGRRG